MRLARLVLLAGLAACSSGKSKHRPEARPEPTKNIDPATTGTVEGAVSFTGTPPANETISFSEPTCTRGLSGSVHADKVLVHDGKLENAFVWVKSGLEDYRFPDKQDEVVLDQKNCIYRPLVVGVQTGQPLTFLNSDPLLHNVHTVPEENDSLNAAMQTTGVRKTIKLDWPEVMVRTKCDIHPWMRAYIGVVAHPFFKVTGSDGAFHFEGLPPGEYEIGAWHEVYGTQSVKVTVATGQSARADFTFAAK